MDFPTSEKKNRKGMEHEIQVSKTSTTESPPLEKPTAEDKQKESLVIYFLYCTGSYGDIQSIIVHKMRVDDAMYRGKGRNLVSINSFYFMQL